jgi:hypothetical protein
MLILLLLILFLQLKQLRLLLPFLLLPFPEPHIFTLTILVSSFHQFPFVLQLFLPREVVALFIHLYFLSIMFFQKVGVISTQIHLNL